MAGIIELMQCQFQSCPRTLLYDCRVDIVIQTGIHCEGIKEHHRRCRRAHRCPRPHNINSRFLGRRCRRRTRRHRLHSLHRGRFVWRCCWRGRAGHGERWVGGGRGWDGGGDGMVVPSSSYQQLQCDLQHQGRHRHRRFEWITPSDRPCDTMPWCFCIVCLEFAISTSIPHINLHLSSPSLSAFQSPSQSPYLSPSPSPYPSPLQPNLLNPAG